VRFLTLPSKIRPVGLCKVFAQRAFRKLSHAPPT
jgi:hypothetical protein